jgi:hypothetical protein
VAQLRSLALLGALALAPDGLAAQAPLPLKYSGSPTTAAITAGDLMTRLYLFADDSMMGREAGTVGAMKGTAYIAAEAARLGLRPAGDNGTYFQNVPFISRRLNPNATLLVDGGSLAPFQDFVALGFRGAYPRLLEGAQAVYGGAISDTAHQLTAEQAAGKLVVLSGPGARTFPRISADGRYGRAAGVAVIVGPQLSTQNLVSGRTPSMTLKPTPGSATVPIVLLVTRAGAEKLLGGSLDGVPVGTTGKTMRGNLEYIETDAPTRNVVALLPGVDDRFKGQYVAIGAHSDHVGYRAAGPVDHDSLHIYNAKVFFATENPTGARLTAEQHEQQRARVAGIRVNLDSLRALRTARPDSISNGADDDGSGSVTVLEVAEALARGSEKPKRSVLFVWHTGEEKGLLGSRYFTDHPTVPRDSIVAQINIDMVGRGAASDLAAGGERYLQLVGSRRLSTELGDLAETVNRSERMPFNIDYTYDADGHPENIYCRSDHYNYARYGIPVVFLMTGLHGDYHQVTDEPQYIDYPHMERVARYVHDLTTRVADLDHRVVVDKPKPDPTGTCRQ